VGEIFIDDGVSIVPNSSRIVNLSVSDRTLKVSSRGNYSVAEPLGNVIVLGTEKPETVTYSRAQVNWSWDNGALKIRGFGHTSAWNDPWTLSWR